MLEPNEAVTMWLALDEVDDENGCFAISHIHTVRPIEAHQYFAFDISEKSVPAQSIAGTPEARYF